MHKLKPYIFSILILAISVFIGAGIGYLIPSSGLSEGLGIFFNSTLLFFMLGCLTVIYLFKTNKVILYLSIILLALAVFAFIIIS